MGPLLHAAPHWEETLDKPSLLSRTVHGLAYLTGLAPRLAGRTQQARIVMLHGVGGNDYPVPILTEQLRWLAQNFRVLPLADLVALVASGVRPEGDEIALTFDDGLRNNAQVAAPLLTQFGLPATFFVCPQLIESGAWLWNHEMRARLASKRPATGAKSAADLIAHMKTLGPEARRAAQEQVRAETPDFLPTDAQRQAYDMMSLDELRALDPDRIAIGSHSLTHPILPTLDEPQLQREVQQSRVQLEALLDRPVPHFCYPDGALDERTQACVAEVYEAAVTTHPASVPAQADLHRLPRVGAVPHAAEFAWRLFRP